MCSLPSVHEGNYVLDEAFSGVWVQLVFGQENVVLLGVSGIGANDWALVSDAIRCNNEISFVSFTNKFVVGPPSHTCVIGSSRCNSCCVASKSGQKCPSRLMEFLKFLVVINAIGRGYFGVHKRSLEESIDWLLDSVIPVQIGFLDTKDVSIHVYHCLYCSTPLEIVICSGEGVDVFGDHSELYWICSRGIAPVIVC